jgi:7-carboxy-7-deazaguanine synthase
MAARQTASIRMKEIRQPTRPDQLASIQINEIFGPTVQGEGVSIGIPAVFVRVAGCPLACVWCDTAYSWNWDAYDRTAESTTMTPAEVWAAVQDRVQDAPVRTLVITGGEPATQARALAPVAEYATTAGWRVEIETSGSISLGPLAALCDVITVSLKLRNSHQDERRRIVPGVIEELTAHAGVVWKFVIEDVTDLDEVDRLVHRFGLSTVLVMPQAQTAIALNERLRVLTPAAVARGYRVSTRLHIQMWDGVRGR